MQTSFWPQHEAHLRWTQITLRLSGKSLFPVEWQLIKSTRRPRVNSQGNLSICRSLAIHLRDLPHLPSGQARSDVSLLDLDPYGSTNPLCMFPFLKRTADVLTPHLSVLFRRFVRLGSFPGDRPITCLLYCWRQGNVTPIPKAPPSSSLGNYWPIFITSVMSKVFELLVSVRLGRLWNPVVCFQPPSLLIGKIWVAVMHFCECPIQL